MWSIIKIANYSFPHTNQKEYLSDRKKLSVESTDVNISPKQKGFNADDLFPNITFRFVNSLLSSLLTDCLVLQKNNVKYVTQFLVTKEPNKCAIVYLPKLSFPNKLYTALGRVHSAFISLADVSNLLLLTGVKLTRPDGRY